MSRLVFPTRQPILYKQLKSISHPDDLQISKVTKSINFEDLSISSSIPSSITDSPRFTEKADISTAWEFDNLFFSSIVGIDNPPRVMSKELIISLGDRFTQDLILEGIFPLSLRELLDGISNLQGEKALSHRQLFLVAEGGQHQGSNPEFPLNARLVFSWRKSTSSFAEILLSTVPHLDEQNSLMQLIAWSSRDGAYHFFERLGKFWTWAGSGHHAFDKRSRGLGPFDSHINGGLVMKELKFPWAHWHSMANTIPTALLKGTDFGNHPALSTLDRAEDLESIMKRATRKWVSSRLEQDKKVGEIQEPVRYLRQVLTATSVNLVSTAEEYSSTLTGPMIFPRSFFMDTDTIRKLARKAGISNPIPPEPITVEAAHYIKAVRDLDIGVQMSDQGPRVVGDTHFCFLVPERAFEDHVVVLALERAKLLSAKMLLCMHMVDFVNPVESRIREVLMRNVPTISIPFKKNSLEEPILHEIRRHASLGENAEEIFLSYWDADDFETKISSDITSFFAALRQNLSSANGVLKVTKLAEARRNRFRRRKLHEFEATIAKSTEQIPELYMDKNAEIYAMESFD